MMTQPDARAGSFPPSNESGDQAPRSHHSPIESWQPIETAPDDFERPGGQRHVWLRDLEGAEAIGRRAYFNNSGWVVKGSNREIWPTHWCALPAPPEVTP